MEDSGYFSHCSSEFRFSDSSASSSRRFIPTPEDIFQLSFDELNSSKYRYFRYGFADEDDFEDFKKDLQNFRRLRKETREIIHSDSTGDPDTRWSSWDRSQVSQSVTCSDADCEDTQTSDGLGLRAPGSRDDRPGSQLGDDDDSLAGRDGACSSRSVTRQTPAYDTWTDAGDHTAAGRGRVRRADRQSGGADRRHDTKRNGVCFDNDDDCFLEASSAFYVADGDDQNVGVARPAVEQGKKHSGKRVSFRESPETFRLTQEDASPEHTGCSGHPSDFLSSRGPGREGEAPSRSFPRQSPSSVKRRTASDSLDLTSRSHEPTAPVLRRAFSEDQPGATRVPLTIPVRSVRPQTAGHRAADGLCARATPGGGEESERTAAKPSACPARPPQPRHAGDHDNGDDIGWRGERDPPKRFSFLGSVRRQDRPRSGRLDSFMEFFNGDEHFLEFERVFETINNHRFSRDLDPRQAGGAWGRADGPDQGLVEDEELGDLQLDESFSDFFEHDEDFLEFERELEKVRSNRRSRLLESLNKRASGDAFDVRAFCDRSSEGGRRTGGPSDPRDSSTREAPEVDLWNSAEEWEVVMNRLKRGSRLLSARSNTARADEFPVRSLGTSQKRHSLDERCPCVRDCQYTCHLNCVPSVTLDCTTVSQAPDVYNIATPTDIPSPSASAETSLTDRRRFVNQQQTPQQQALRVSAAVPSSLQSSQPCCRPSELTSQSCGPRGHLLQTESQQPHSATDSTSHGVSSSRNLPTSRGILSTPDVLKDPLLGTSLCQTSTTALPSSSSPSTSSSHMFGNSNSKDFGQNAKTNMGGSTLERGGIEDESDFSTEKDETDSGYRSGTIPDDKLPKAPSQATLTRQDLRRKIEIYNHYVPKANLEQMEDGMSFQGFLHVTLNLIRPITMELGARPPSIYELLTREHIVEQSTQHVAFYMPRDTVKSIHTTSKTTTREVVTGLLKKFHILDNPRKFAMYEQEFNEKNKLVKLKRLNDKDNPLVATLAWDPERIKFYRLVMQENETGEIVWENFSLPELNNFLKVLDREEDEAVAQLRYKYRVMKRIILQQLKEHRKERPSSADPSDT